MFGRTAFGHTFDAAWDRTRDWWTARPDTARTLATYTVLMGGVLLLSSLQNLVWPRLLSPASYGYYAIALTVAAYGAPLQLGLLSGLNRELPVRLGRGDRSYAGTLVGTSTTLLLGAWVLCAAVYLPLVRVQAQDQPSRAALMLGAGILLSGTLAQLVVLRLRVEQRVVAFPAVLLAQKVAILLLGSIACLYWGVTGLLVLTVAVEAIAFVYVTRRWLSPVPYWPIDWRSLRPLLGIGLPLMAANWLDGVSTMMDRLFLARTVSPDSLGLYHFGAFPLTIGAAISSVAGQYLSPKLLNGYGRDGSLLRVFRASSLASLAILLAFLAGWPIFTALCRLLVRFWLPAYAPSLNLLSVFYVGAMCAAAIPVQITINAANRQSLYVVKSVIVATFCLGGYSILAWLGADPAWYAGVAASALALNLILCFAFAWLCAHRPRRAQGDAAHGEPHTTPATLSRLPPRVSSPAGPTDH